MYCITENFRGLTSRGSEFIDIHQARARSKLGFKIHLLTFTKRAWNKLAIVYTRDARNGDLCQVVQYYGYVRTR